MYKLFTDGGSRGNPGAAAIGYVIWNENELIEFDAQYIGIATNNIAEYKALESGLQKLIKLNVGEVMICMDSELVVKQLNGEYAVKNSEILKIYSKIHKILESFGEVEIKYIPRAQNKIADRLVNIALDMIEKK